jgi:UDP-N-acetylmuramate dehydrogenase
MRRLDGARLSSFTTLRVGGPAERLAIAGHVDELAEAALESQREGEPLTIIGWGSNLLPSDRGVAGLTLVNDSRHIEIFPDGRVIADAGCGFQELFLKTLQAGWAGLEFAVGIPGSLGGALVSNAGAYRSAVSRLLTRIEVVHEGERKWVEPDFMQFKYRDSRLRQPNPEPCALLRVELQLPRADLKESYDLARDNQRQRIGKQPPSASAGSFFKNVNDKAFAESLPDLREDLKASGVVPAGHLIERVGLRGARLGGAMIGQRHANFMLNARGATAAEIRRLAEHAQAKVRDRYGVELEAEVLMIGDWSGWQVTGLMQP